MTFHCHGTEGHVVVEKGDLFQVEGADDSAVCLGRTVDRGHPDDHASAGRQGDRILVCCETLGHLDGSYLVFHVEVYRLDGPYLVFRVRACLGPYLVYRAGVCLLDGPNLVFRVGVCLLDGPNLVCRVGACLLDGPYLVFRAAVSLLDGPYLVFRVRGDLQSGVYLILIRITQALQGVPCLVYLKVVLQVTLALQNGLDRVADGLRKEPYLVYPKRALPSTLGVLVYHGFDLDLPTDPYQVSRSAAEKADHRED